MPTSRRFGGFTATTDYASAEISREGDRVRTDVNLAAPAAFAQAEADAIDRYLDELDRHDAAARAAFAAVMNDDESEPAQVWRFHHEEVAGHEDLTRDAFVATLELVRVGFYPDAAFGTQSYVVLDYAVPGPQTDQLLVAKFLRDESLFDIAWES